MYNFEDEVDEEGQGDFNQENSLIVVDIVEGIGGGIDCVVDHLIVIWIINESNQFISTIHPSQKLI